MGKSYNREHCDSSVPRWQLGDKRILDSRSQPPRWRQFRVHEPSEHHSDGKAFPMEMRLVHQDDRGHILMIAVMWELGVEEPVLGKLWQWLPEQIGQEVSIPRTGALPIFS